MSWLLIDMSPLKAAKAEELNRNKRPMVGKKTLSIERFARRGRELNVSGANNNFRFILRFYSVATKVSCSVLGSFALLVSISSILSIRLIEATLSFGRSLIK